MGDSSGKSMSPKTPQSGLLEEAEAMPAESIPSVAIPNGSIPSIL